MQIIDAHAHISGDHPPVVEMMKQLGVKALNICVVHEPGNSWRRHRGDGYHRAATELPDVFSWCTSFDLPGFDDPSYAQRVIDGIERDFADGTLAVKVWKCIGMELKDPAGQFVQIDHPVFEPILAHLERTGRTLLMHLGEPLACWQPLRPGSPHFNYYSQNPQWHMLGKAFPSHAQIMAARDRVVARHPKLRCVGAHLGSLEYDLNEMALRLDRFPNFCLDTSARLEDLKLFPTDKLLAFFLRYQDRLLFSTDNSVPPIAETTEPQRQALYRDFPTTYQREFDFFQTDQIVPGVAGPVRGLNLPASVLEKFYTTNAQRWYPGL